MGAGKSTIGALLAKGLNRPFFDIDEQIKAEIGKSISEIFAECGEAGFRQLEVRFCKIAAGLQNSVIATGGGCVESSENITLLKQGAKMIYLQISPNTALARIADIKSRPMLNTADPLAKAQEMMTRRVPMYEKAACHIVNGEGGIREVLESILRVL